MNEKNSSSCADLSKTSDAQKTMSLLRHDAASDTTAPLTRRGFLRNGLYISALGAGIEALTACKRGPQKIVVLGAGISGLAAAQTLKQLGHQVQVLEAKDRIGGRIWTDNSMGVPIDLGAMFLHGNKKNPLTPMLQQYSSLFRIDYFQTTLYDSHGAQVDGSIVQQAIHIFRKGLEELIHHPQGEHLNLSIQEAFDWWLKRQPDTPAHRFVRSWALSVFTMKEGANLHAISMPGWYDSDSCLGGDHFIPASYSPVVLSLAKGLDIRLRHPVSRISYPRSTGVDIQTPQGTIHADCVLVTASLGALQSGNIAFAPALPPFKQRAIQALGMGVLNKVVLQFPRIFWPRTPLFFGYHSPIPGEFPLIVNMTRYLHHPLLMGVSGGNYGMELEQQPDEEIITRMMDILKKMFGSKIPDPTRHLITRWSRDPFSWGSYSHIPLQQTPAYYDDLAEPVANRIFFAGEATYRRYPTTVHGAYLSGLREAARIHSR